MFASLRTICTQTRSHSDAGRRPQTLADPGVIAMRLSTPNNTHCSNPRLSTKSAVSSEQTVGQCLCVVTARMCRLQNATTYDAENAYSRAPLSASCHGRVDATLLLSSGSSNIATCGRNGAAGVDDRWNLYDWQAAVAFLLRFPALRRDGFSPSGPVGGMAAFESVTGG